MSANEKTDSAAFLSYRGATFGVLPQLQENRKRKYDGNMDSPWEKTDGAPNFSNIPTRTQAEEQKKEEEECEDIVNKITSSSKRKRLKLSEDVKTSLDVLQALRTERVTEKSIQDAIFNHILIENK